MIIQSNSDEPQQDDEDHLKNDEDVVRVNTLDSKSKKIETLFKTLLNVI